MGRGLFFGDQRNFGESGAQPGGNQRVCGLVRLGHGRGVGFHADLEILDAIDAHDVLAGQQGKPAHLGNHLIELHGLSFRSRVYRHAALTV